MIFENELLPNLIIYTLLDTSPTSLRKFSFCRVRWASIHLIKKHSNPTKTGGINVLDRDNSKTLKRTDYDKVLSDINFYQTRKFNSVAELIYDSYSLFNKSVIYKNKIQEPLGVIELGHKLQNHDSEKLVQAYKSNFDEVYFINIRRDFYSWLNSFCSQFYSSANEKTKIFSRLSNMREPFDRYENSLKHFKGIDIDFNEIFLPNTQKLVNKISLFLNINSAEDIDWNERIYDHYGNLKNYNESFRTWYFDRISDDEKKFLFKRLYSVEETESTNIFKRLLSLSVRTLKPP